MVLEPRGDRVVDAGREDQRFTVYVQHADGVEECITARAVIDASGTWTAPGPLGGDGLPALGERTATDRISYRVPDLKDPAVRARHAGKRTAVIGSGASAFTALGRGRRPARRDRRDPGARGLPAGALHRRACRGSRP
ncbi:hypothetical protein T261_8228 [Streptomyces lydicus]|nr:hypothetical protein T261_8228 [Streptomyces lydicus]